MKYLLPIITLLLTANFLLAQQPDIKSIHQEQSEYYAANPKEIFDTEQKKNSSLQPNCSLEKVVFGYHPFWMGNAYLNYQWNLLSDLSYFSYEVDPATGDPNVPHYWLTDPVIDSAQAHGVRTHLCMTLFSGHSTFFSNPDAQQNLINNLISLVGQRNADGINLDFEAVPSAWGDEMISFIVDLSNQYRTVDPEGMLSIAMPAVDWSGIFNVEALKNHIDLFFIMGYDYYVNGSGQAGPVAPLYAMTGSYNYSLSRTVSNYQSAGMPLDKMLLGVPYYGRQWRTKDSLAPSNVSGYGAAYKYSTIKNGSYGHYKPSNNRWEDHSFSAYYSFFNNNSWYQCFLSETRDFEERYNMVNYRGLAGIGIWALGYDNGYTELWELIADKFSDCATPLCSDIIYDSGGPYWNYFNEEDYTITLSSCNDIPIVIVFDDFSLEAGYDSLWVYDGADTSASLIGTFTGSEIPNPLICSDSVACLRFTSDEGMTYQGWRARWENGYLFINPAVENTPDFKIFPNPASEYFKLDLKEFDGFDEVDVLLTDILGREIVKKTVRRANGPVLFSVDGLQTGAYMVFVRVSGINLSLEKLLIIE